MSEHQHDQEPDEDEQPAAEDDDESPEEFAKEIESDPAHNPDDPGLDALRGG